MKEWRRARRKSQKISLKPFIEYEASSLWHHSQCAHMISQSEFDCAVVNSLMASRRAEVYTVEDLLRCCTIQQLPV